MVRLVGEVAGLTSPLTNRRRVLMEGLAEMVGADGWLWSTSVLDPKDPCPSSINVVHGGLTDHQLTGILEQSVIPKEKPPEDVELANLTMEGEHFTRTRQQLVPDKDWYQHATVRDYRLERGLDDFLYSIYPLTDVAFSAIGLFRHRGREPFAERERRISHILLSNIDWLHRAGLPEHEGAAVPDLTPRQRMVLAYLLQGYSRSEAAEALELSLHTLNDHVKALFRHFDVRSQIELIRHFTVGDGRDTDASKI